MFIFNDPLLLIILFIFVLILIILPICNKKETNKLDEKPITFMNIFKYMIIGVCLGVICYLFYISCKSSTVDTGKDDNNGTVIEFESSDTYISNIDGTPAIFDILQIDNEGKLDKLHLISNIKTNNTNNAFAYLKLKNDIEPFAQIFILNNGHISFEYSDINKEIKKGDILSLVLIGTENNIIEFDKLKLKLKI